jgi:uncharacterized protein YqeY
MALIDTLRKDIFAAIKEGNQVKAGILQIAVGSIKNEELRRFEYHGEGEKLTEEDAIRILRTEVKKVKDSIEQFKTAGRQDLVDKESAQLIVLESYLPALMSEDDITKIIQVKMNELNVIGMSDMGRLMGVVMKELSGKADGAIVKQIVTNLLSNKK